MVRYLTGCPELRPALLFLKYYLAEKNLNNTYLGGLNAYGLSLLMIAFRESRKITKVDTGEFLMQFIEFVANEFHPGQTSVNLGPDLCNKETPFVSRSSQDPYAGSAVYIQDPSTSHPYNVTQGLISWSLIQKLFIRITGKYQQLNQQTNQEILEKIQSQTKPDEKPTSQIEQSIREQIKGPLLVQLFDVSDMFLCPELTFYSDFK